MNRRKPKIQADKLRASAVFGEGPALQFIDRKIAESPNGENDAVIASEQQLLHVLGMMELKGRGEP